MWKKKNKDTFEADSENKKDFDRETYIRGLGRGESEKSAKARATHSKPKHREVEIVDGKKITWGGI